MATRPRPNGSAQIDKQSAAADHRLAELTAWLETLPGYVADSLRPASADASFRRYFRLRANGGSYIAMDAPPEMEDSLPFVRIAGYLEAMRLNAPVIVEADMERGFLLLSDLGHTQYLQQLKAMPSAVDRLYADALAALATLQQRGAAYQSHLPPYDAALLSMEMGLFRDWLCGVHLGIEFSSIEELAWRKTCSLLMRSALDQPQVFVHLDYHSRNLMVTEANNPGILDFQDAVEGPWTYDLVSLLKDCYFALPPEQVMHYALGFYEQSEAASHGTLGTEQFVRDFELMGVQRHLKAAGIFARLNHRDGKRNYMDDIPRTLAYIDGVMDRYEELAFLADLLRSRVLPGLAS
jgi:hypothetical protein